MFITQMAERNLNRVSLINEREEDKKINLLLGW
jgi:hypothetical protein